MTNPSNNDQKRKPRWSFRSGVYEPGQRQSQTRGEIPRTMPEKIWSNRMTVWVDPRTARTCKRGHFWPRDGQFHSIKSKERVNQCRLFQLPFLINNLTNSRFLSEEYKLKNVRDPPIFFSIMAIQGNEHSIPRKKIFNSIEYETTVIQMRNSELFSQSLNWEKMHPVRDS